MEAGKTEKIVLAHSKEIAEARKRYPEISKEIENFKKDVTRIVKELNIEIRSIDSEEDRELISVLVINGIHRMTDEVFL